jgi:hypothetical protein
VAFEINYEDSDLRCVHSGEAIESAYGSDDLSPDQEAAHERRQLGSYGA